MKIQIPILAVGEGIAASVIQDSLTINFGRVVSGGGDRLLLLALVSIGGLEGPITRLALGISSSLIEVSGLSLYSFLLNPGGSAGPILLILFLKYKELIILGKYHTITCILRS